MRHLQRGADLAGGIGEDLGVRIGRRARHVAAVCEQIRGTPEQADLARCHLLLEQIGDGVEIGDGLGERCTFRRRIDVVEGEIGHVEQAEQLEGDVGLGARLFHRIRAVVPGPQERLAAEGITARPAQRMPVAGRKAQMILEPAAVDDAVLVVPAEGKRTGCILAAEGDRCVCIEESG